MVPTAAPQATVAPTSQSEPTADALQSQLDGAPVDSAGAGAPADEAPSSRPTVGPIPNETITPADQCDPDQPPPRFGRGTPGGFSAFRAPLPPTPLWNPPGQKRVGLQVGHWKLDETPPELSRLQGGATGGGMEEWQVNLGIAQAAQSVLESYGYAVDVLPATVPVRYQANAFVAIHADGDTNGSLSGFKVARPGFSSIPDFDDQLVAALNDAYGQETGLARDDAHISLRMTYYYAFNSRLYCHAVAPGVPQAIMETGFLTNASDRRLLIGNPAEAGHAVADGIRAFLNALP